QEMIFAPDRRHATGREFGHFRLIAANDEERLAVGREEHRVRAVLAAAALKGAKLLRLIELAVTVRVADAVERRAAAIDHDVEAVEGPEKALSAADKSRIVGVFDWKRF